MVIFALTVHNTVTVSQTDALVGFAMWFPTQDEAVELYARFLAARHGSAAERHARRTAERLQTEGDHAGHAIWSRVADAVEQSKAKEPRRALT